MQNHKSAFLFPGQGAYVPGVLPQLAKSWPRSREIFNRVDATCIEAGIPLVSDILDDPAPIALDEMVQRMPERLQLILYCTSVAAFSLLRDLEDAPFWLIGHSLGEIAALVCGGAFSIDDGARIIHARNRALKSLAQRDGAMLAVNIEAERANALVRLLANPRIRVACYNGPRQCVLSGPKSELDIAQALTATLGLGSTAVASPYPFHNPMLAPAVDGFAEAIRPLRQRPLERPVYSPIHGRVYEDRDDLARLIAEHLVKPVAFAEALRTGHEAGIDRFVECGAGAALTGLAVRTIPAIQTFAPLANTDNLQTRPADPASVASHSAPPVSGRLPREPTSELVTPERSNPTAEPVVIAIRPELRSSLSEAPVSAGEPNAEIAATIRDICAGLLGYPPEVFEAEADLEVELGIDSIKRVELELTILKRFGLPAERRIGMAAGTFGELVAAVAALRQARQTEAAQ